MHTNSFKNPRPSFFFFRPHPLTILLKISYYASWFWQIVKLFPEVRIFFIVASLKRRSNFSNDFTSFYFRRIESCAFETSYQCVHTCSYFFQLNTFFVDFYSCISNRAITETTGSTFSIYYWPFSIRRIAKNQQNKNLTRPSHQRTSCNNSNTYPIHTKFWNNMN